MNSLPLNEKYRPTSIQQILGNEEVLIALEKITNSQEIPHLLFYGPPGTGKTTTIRAMASAMYKKTPSSVLELNASDERGIETVRQSIKKFAETKSFTNNKKLIILDEADSMSKDAQNCLRRIIEDFSQNCRFCLIANYSSKIIQPILSRCMKFRFSPVETNNDQKTESGTTMMCGSAASSSQSSVFKRIAQICDSEGISYEKDALLLLIHRSQGDMRKLFNDIEGLKNGFGVINTTNVYSICGGAHDEVFHDIFIKLRTLAFKELRVSIKAVQTAFSLDCETLIENLGEIAAKSDMKGKMKILKNLADIQERLSIGCSQEIQTTALITTFLEYR